MGTGDEIARTTSDEPGTAAVSVVIPFYQRDEGVLTRALDAVFAQTHRVAEIIVVDDESPLSPLAEVGARAAEERERIEVIVQPNGGPGAARNAGLDAVATASRYVAFLDSDDVWRPQHVATAVGALERGYDFYFCDYTWPSRTSTRFAQVGIPDVLDTEPVADGLYPVGDLPELVLGHWPVHISACAIRRDALGSVRFDPRMRRSSEDQMYFLALARRRPRVCAGLEVNMALDDGANMFRNSPTGTFDFARTRIANAYFHRLVAQSDELGAGARRTNAMHLRVNMKAFALSEAKALLRSGRLHPSLYPAALRVFMARRPPDVSPV